MSTFLGGCDHGEDFANFDSLTIQRTGSFELDLNADDAFPLFTAFGETLWAPGWEPFILNGDGYEEGTVWVTMGHGHTTYWYVAGYDTEAKRARYVRVTPEADAGTVEVVVKPNGEDNSTVNVTYQLTGLSKAGNDRLSESYGEDQYSEMMQHWREAILNASDKINEHLGR